jgi:hypothetical protein
MNFRPDGKVEAGPLREIFTWQPPRASQEEVESQSERRLKDESSRGHRSGTRPRPPDRA